MAQKTKKQKKKKKIKSHVTRLKMQQRKHPVSPEKYKKRLRVARRKDIVRNLWKIPVGVVIAVVALFLLGNLALYQRTGDNLITLAQEAQEVVDNSSADDFRYASTTYVYSADDTMIAELAEDEDATYLTYDEIPDDVVNAFVSVEDRTFWTNSGVDYKGIIRVCWNYVRTRGEVAEGASTITQQLARSVFLSREKTMLRKLKEIFIARDLAKKYSKEEIMEFYCNTCYFANGVYGVEDAAETYFSQPLDDLTLSQTAYICAIPNRPEYYNPLLSPDNAIDRRDKILENMEECAYITSDDYQAALAEEIVLSDIQEDTVFYNYEVTYAIDCATRYLMQLDGFEFRYEFSTEEDYDQYNAEYEDAYDQANHKLYTGGYEVHTTIDLEEQDKMQEVLDEQLAFSETLTESGIYELQGAMTVIDNNTGKVIAIVGGRSQEADDDIYSLNRAYQSYNQPGSSFKPLAVYTPALSNGYSAASELTSVDVAEAKETKEQKVTQMKGEKMSLREAVEESNNGCAYWLFNEISPQVGLSYVTNMDFSKIVPDDYTLSASLGGLTHGVTTVEMANAYYTLENHGEYTQTDCLDVIYDSTGNNIYNDPEGKTIYDRNAADQMTDIMKGVITEGTAQKMNWSEYTDIAAAGKTGTTNDNKAGWFCGYTPYYTIAAWVGCDTPKAVEDLQGNTYPLQVWEEAMLQMTDNLPAKDFQLSFEEVSEYPVVDDYNADDDYTDKSKKSYSYDDDDDSYTGSSSKKSYDYDDDDDSYTGSSSKKSYDYDDDDDSYTSSSSKKSYDYDDDDYDYDYDDDDDDYDYDYDDDDYDYDYDYDDDYDYDYDYDDDYDDDTKTYSNYDTGEDDDEDEY